jgi:proline iminopeptidase
MTIQASPQETRPRGFTMSRSAPTRLFQSLRCPRIGPVLLLPTLASSGDLTKGLTKGLILGLTLCSLTLPPISAQQRESIFDRVIHLEASVITEIPDVPRLEESLGIEGRKISVGDAELWVEEEGSGVPLVLINGGPGGTHHMFHPWFGRAANFARVIYYDQRGCGLSDYEPGPDGYSVHQAMEDLEGLRKALKLDRFVLAGFSYGGFLAQYYTLHYPENVAGLVLVGASPAIDADLGRSRQRDFMSPEELDMRQRILAELRELAPGMGWTDAEVLALVVYNNFRNGDWKRQNYYKPSPEKMAQIALYEWVQDSNFNQVMGQSMTGIDFTGAFDANPIPTLIMEGEWDLTWGPEKKTALADNHPKGKLVVFEEAGHGIFDEDPDGFFSTLQGFVEGLKPPDGRALSAFAEGLESLRQTWAEARDSRPKPMDWGMAASRAMANEFSRGEMSLNDVETPSEYLRLGFALYDVERYDDAQAIFKTFWSWAEANEEPSFSALACIWAGHMLDLLGRREEAIDWYQKAAEKNLDDTWSHGQYGMRYSLSEWAIQRMETPFERIENRGE